MPGLFRDPRRALAIVLPLTAASGCTVDNPVFGLTAPATDGSDGPASTGGATSVAVTTTGPDTTTTPTTTIDPGTTTIEPGTTTVSGTSMPAGVCGDGVVDPGELCDDGNAMSGDECEPDCTTPDCGDGVVGGGEQCDDGNDADDDACLGTCVVASCGDGQIQAMVEECDDSNTNPGDGCSSVCSAEICGNGVLDAREQCDDGNNDDTDNCTSKCEAAKCGDSFVQGAEECDDANLDDLDACKNDCTKNPCGDGVFDIQNEQCDWSADPFKKYVGLCSEVCAINSCVKLANTADTDLVGVDWFKPCIDAVGSQVHVGVLNSNKQVVYFASGMKNVAWTYEAVTSNVIGSEQYKLVNHKPIEIGSAKDRLFITSRSSIPAIDVCPSSLGDGYGVIILPAVGDAAKLLFMPNVGKSGKVRNFKNWSASNELSFNPNGMSLCLAPGPTPTIDATVIFAVTP